MIDIDGIIIIIIIILVENSLVLLVDHSITFLWQLKISGVSVS